MVEEVPFMKQCDEVLQVNYRPTQETLQPVVLIDRQSFVMRKEYLKSLIYAYVLCSPPQSFLTPEQSGYIAIV